MCGSMMVCTIYVLWHDTCPEGKGRSYEKCVNIWVCLSLGTYVRELPTCGHASIGLLRRGVPVSRKARLAPRTTLPTNWDLQ